MSPSLQKTLNQSALPGIGTAGAVGFTVLLFLLVVWVQRETEIVPPEPEAEITPFAVPPPPPPPRTGAQSRAKPVELIPFDIPIVQSTPDISMEFLELNFDVGPTATIEVDLDVDSYARESLKKSFETPAVFESHEVDREVQLVYSPTPPIPLKLRGKQTRVSVMYIVNKQGRSERILVMDNTDPVVVKFVQDSIRKWRFEPARKDGRKVRVWVEQAFVILEARKGASDPFSL